MYLIVEVFFLLNNCGCLVLIFLDIDEIELYINNYLVQDLLVYFLILFVKKILVVYVKMYDGKFIVKNYDMFNYL